MKMSQKDRLIGAYGDDKLPIPEFLRNPQSQWINESKAAIDETAEDGVEMVLDRPKAVKPDHYNKGVSPYQVGQSMYGPVGLQTYVIINALKYIQRYPFKYKGSPEKQLDDLIKAKESIETAIELHKVINGESKIRHG